MLQEGVVEIALAAFMRGRTFKRAFIVALKCKCYKKSNGKCANWN